MQGGFLSQNKQAFMNGNQDPKSMQFYNISFQFEPEHFSCLRNNVHRIHATFLFQNIYKERRKQFTGWYLLRDFRFSNPIAQSKGRCYLNSVEILEIYCHLLKNYENEMNCVEKLEYLRSHSSSSSNRYSNYT